MMFWIDGQPVGRLLQFEKTTTPNSIVNAALDGTPYIQIVGDPSSVATIQLFAETVPVMELIDHAAAYGMPISCEYHGARYEGYITKAVSWKWLKKGVSAIGTATLMVVTI